MSEARPERKLRVAVLSRVFARTGGGAESYSINLVEALATSHEIHVFAQQIDHAWPGVAYHRVSSPGPKPRWVNQLWFAWASWRATRRGFDVVHSHENTWHGNVQTIHVRPLRFNLLAGKTGWALALRWLKIAVSPRLITYVALEAARFRVRPGRQVPVASESLKREVLQVYPHAAHMLSVLAPGVHAPRADGPSKLQARRALGVEEGAFALLLVANDFARKGLDALLSALALLPSNTILLIAGKGLFTLALREKCLKFGLLEQRLRFLGPVADLGPVYTAADALVHPTLEDSFGMVVLEAMAHGLPVVVSGPAYCGAADLLTHGIDALLLPDPRDAIAIAQAVHNLMADPAKAQALALAGQRLAQAHQWQSVAQHYDRIYQQISHPV